MTTFLVVMFLIALAIFIVEWGAKWFIFQMSQFDTWWSPVRQLPPPGEMYIVVRGDEDGPFDTVLESVPTHKYNSTTHEFEDTPLDAPETAQGYLGEIGVAWVGFFRHFKCPEVKYDKWEKKPNSSEWGLVAKIRKGPSVFFRYNLATEVKAAETVGNFPVDAIIVFTVEIWKPILAFFLAGGWEIQATAAVAGLFRHYVGNMTIEQLRTEHGTRGGATLIDQIKGLSTNLFSLFGIKITDAKFVQFDLVHGDEKMTAAVRAKEIARLEAEADKLRGEGERDKRTARAAGVKAEVEAWGSHPVGAAVAIAEAIKEAKPNVIGGDVVAAVNPERKK